MLDYDLQLRTFFFRQLEYQLVPLSCIGGCVLVKECKGRISTLWVANMNRQSPFQKQDA